MTECGVRLDHATIQRGVVQDSPLLEEALHRRTRPMLGFKAFEATQATLTGIERMHRLKKKQMVIEARDEVSLRLNCSTRWLRNLRTGPTVSLHLPKRSLQHNRTRR